MFWLLVSLVWAQEPVDSEPATSWVSEVHETDTGVTIVLNGTTHGPYPVPATAVAWSDDRHHFALIVPRKTRHWLLVVDGHGTAYIGPDRMENVRFTDADKIRFDQYWGPRREVVTRSLPPPSPSP